MNGNSSSAETAGATGNNSAALLLLCLGNGVAALGAHLDSQRSTEVAAPYDPPPRFRSQPGLVTLLWDVVDNHTAPRMKTNCIGNGIIRN